MTLTKKTWKYIFYAVIALVLLYVVFFSSKREHFKSLNPIPTGGELDALQASLDRAFADRSKNNTSVEQIGSNVLQSAPESVKAVAKYLKANVLPLLPYSMAKTAQTPNGDMTDYYIVLYMLMANKPLIAPLAYAIRQQSSAPTLSEFVDMAIKTFKENATPPPPADWPKNSQESDVFDQMKKGETTVKAPQTIPNPAYWGYKYIYGEPKAGGGPAPAVSSTSRTGGSASGGGSGGGGVGTGAKCTPSLQQVPGGITETRCFN